MGKYSIMVLQGRLAELIVKTKPIIYRKFVTIENIWTVLYVKFSEGTLWVPDDCAIILVEYGIRPKFKRVNQQPI